MPKFGLFLPLAIVEHLAVILFCAWLVYQPPSLKIEETTYQVEIFQHKAEKKKINETITSFIPELETTPVDLPPLQSLQNLDSFLSSHVGSSNLPNLRQIRSQASEQWIDKSIPKGRKRRSDETDIDATVHTKAFTSNFGHQSVSEPVGMTDSTGKILRTAGDNQLFSGKVASEGQRKSQSEKVSGVLPYSIEGEVKGRGIRYQPTLSTVAGQVQGGIVRLIFSVKPNGTVYKVKVIENRAGELRQKAQSFVAQFIFNKLPDHLPQQDQSGEITVRFERKE